MIFSNGILEFNTDTGYFDVLVDEVNLTKYLKLAYRNNRSRFEERFVNYFRNFFKAYDIDYYSYLLDNIDNLWDYVKGFSYEEAFKIENNAFRIKVFSAIDINEMIENLGSERIKTEGIETINKVWDEKNKQFKNIPLTLIYELHKVNGEKLGVEDAFLPAIKCWCTSTNKEHWLWVNSEELGDNSPLNGIASTCCIYKSMQGKIKHIIRHGDVFIFEMIEEVIPDENEEVISLGVEEYFKLLKSQS